MELNPRRIREVLNTKKARAIGGLAAVAIWGGDYLYFSNTEHPNFDLITGGLALSATLILYALNGVENSNPRSTEEMEQA